MQTTCIVSISNSLVGVMVNESTWKLVSYMKGKFLIENSEIQSTIKPIQSSNSIFILPGNQGTLEKAAVSHDLKSGTISIGKSSTSDIALPSTSNFVCRHGTGFFWIEQHGSRYHLIECSSVDFGLRLCSALSGGYKAACYIPPHGDRGTVSKSLDESIELTEKLLNLLTGIEDECKVRFPSRKA